MHYIISTRSEDIRMQAIYLGILVMCEFKISDLHTNIFIPYTLFSYLKLKIIQLLTNYTNV